MIVTLFCFVLEPLSGRCVAVSRKHQLGHRLLKFVTWRSYSFKIYQNYCIRGCIWSVDCNFITPRWRIRKAAVQYTNNKFNKCTVYEVMNHRALLWKAVTVLPVFLSIHVARWRNQFVRWEADFVTPNCQMNSRVSASREDRQHNVALNFAIR